MRKEENLQGKIRGKIRIAQQIKKNIIPKREERVYCSFQEYTADTPENRLLKKALLFCKRMVQSLSHQGGTTFQMITQKINQVAYAFEHISDEIEIHEVKYIKAHKIHRDYSEAVRVAKMILRRFDYAISKVSRVQTTTPPFWINMPLLFECYVYRLLDEAYPREILFQEGGNYGKVDFVRVNENEKLVIDAKYKFEYGEGYDIADIRQLSAYARDTKILKELKEPQDTQKIIPCLIIYPKVEKDENLTIEENENTQKDTYKIFSNDDPTQKEKPLIDRSSPISQFKHFYKICVQLPE